MSSSSWNQVMNRRTFLRGAGAACAASVLGGAVGTPDHPGVPSRPNIVLIVADDLGYGDLGCYGGKDIPTPHMDSLAAAGVRFTSGYVTAPFCAPSRAALLTGCYQARFGFEGNPIGPRLADPAVGLPTGERTVADALRDAGYVTAAIGKWHLGGTASYHPQRRGFDEFFGFLHEGHYFVPPPWDGHVTWLRRKALPDGGQGRWTSPDGRVIWTTHMGHFEPNYDADNPILRAGQPVVETENLTDAFTREAESFITRHKAQPFFLYLSYNAVHSPMQGADAYMKKFAHLPDVHRRIYAAMLSHLDDGVGRVLARLRVEGLMERTLVVFLSDNGGPTRELTARNAPWRGGKGTLLEGGVRVAFLMQWPGRLPAGHVEPRMISSLDLFPTFLAAAGRPVPAGRDGVDLLGPLAAPGDAPIHERHFWRLGPQAALREGDWKIYRERAGQSWRLYHLPADPAEEQDLSSQEPARLAALAAAWEKLNAGMAAPQSR
jgi:arylsulfatase A-like enzyme